MSSNPQIWTPENGALLQQLRINAKVDIGKLAQRNIVSRNQIKQLEDGGDSSFYSSEIKYQIGKKVLASLGHKLAPAVALQQDISEVPDLVTIAQVAQRAEAPQAAPSQQGVASNSKVLMSLLVLLVCGGLTWFLMQSETTNGAPAQSQQVIATSNVPVPVTVAVPPAPEPVNVAPNAANAEINSEAAASSPVVKAPPVEVKLAVGSGSDETKNCLWKDAEVELQAPSPKKAAEYVYIIAAKDSFVCIMDGNERVARITMKKGEDRSVYGPAPFKVQSADMAQLKIFFQGQALNLPSAETKQIKLTAAPFK
jgi:hypothetical protein